MGGVALLSSLYLPALDLLDNHDQKQRFNHPAAKMEQIRLGLALLFTRQGIPCLYYGTEQGLQGTLGKNGNRDCSWPDIGSRGAVGEKRRFLLATST